LLDLKSAVIFIVVLDWTDSRTETGRRTATIHAQKMHAQNQRGCAIAASEQHQTFRNFAPKAQQYTRTSSHPARDLIKDL